MIVVFVFLFSITSHMF